MQLIHLLFFNRKKKLYPLARFILLLLFIYFLKGNPVLTLKIHSQTDDYNVTSISFCE